MILLAGRGGNQQKFLGDGQTFKGKLIGVLEVREARGDRMCQDALQELKMAIKASGEHKQKVNIQIAVDGLKIRDEKTGVILFYIIYVVQYNIIQHFYQKVGKKENFNSAPIFRVKHQMSSYISKNVYRTIKVNDSM